MSGLFVAGPRIENGEAIIVPLRLRTWDLMIHNQRNAPKDVSGSGTQD